MVKKISEAGWKQAYYEKWLLMQKAARRKAKDRCQEIHEFDCLYCQEPGNHCNICSLGYCNKRICAGPYTDLDLWDERVNWRRANKLVDEIVEAIRQDGIEWGYLNE